MKVPPSLMTHKKPTQAATHTETMAMGFSITEEAVEDNLYDSLSARYAKPWLVRSGTQKRSERAQTCSTLALLVRLAVMAFLCSTLHTPLVNGGTNGNRPSVAVDLNETSLEAGIIAIGKWTTSVASRLPPVRPSW